MRRANIGQHWTVTDNIILSDDDDDAPLVKITFHNETKKWSKHKKVEFILKHLRRVKKGTR